MVLVRKTLEWLIQKVNATPPVPVPPPSPNPDETTSNPMMGVYVGVPLTILFLLAILGCVYATWQRRKKGSLALSDAYPTELVEKMSPTQTTQTIQNNQIQVLESKSPEEVSQYDPQYWDVAYLSDGKPMAVVPKGTLSPDGIVVTSGNPLHSLSSSPSSALTATVVEEGSRPPGHSYGVTVATDSRNALWKDAFEDE